MKGICIAMAMALSAHVALAQSGEPGPRKGDRGERGERGEPPSPPAEAFEVCKGKSKGDAVTVTMKDGRSMKAVCDVFPGNGQLAARPNDMPPREGGGGRRPPG